MCSMCSMCIVSTLAFTDEPRSLPSIQHEAGDWSAPGLSKRGAQASHCGWAALGATQNEQATRGAGGG
jgi:hypothetical protein